MILGLVTDQGDPQITIPIAGRLWTAIVDTGFNGDLELPEVLRQPLNPTRFGYVHSRLAGGITIKQEAYLVLFPFDGIEMLAETTFVANTRILIGTRLLRRHRLEIDFPRRTLQLTRGDP